MYTVGDFLIQLKNAYMAHKKELTFPYAKIVVALGKILTDEGYVRKSEIKELDGRKIVTVELLYKNKRPALREIKLVSKPSVHKYVTKTNIKKIAGNFGISVVSTSKGVMTGKEALKAGVGGELLCEIQ